MLAIIPMEKDPEYALKNYINRKDALTKLKMSKYAKYSHDSHHIRN